MGLRRHPLSRTRTTFALVALLALPACGATLRPAPVRPGGVAAWSDPGPPPEANWPLDPERAVDLMARGRMEVQSVEPAPDGATGSARMEATFDGVPLVVKWKPVPPGSLDTFNNSPRKELAAFAVQEMVLPPERWLIPPVALRCLPLERLRELGLPHRPTRNGARCGLGMISLWLDGVEVPDHPWDEERFWSDPVYARNVADLDLLTFLIEHQDGKPSNWLQGSETGLLFSVDNGISFGGPFYNYPADNWNGVRVPALAADTVERLRAVEREDLEALQHLVGIELGADGMLRALDDGDDVVLGLSPWEWRGVWRRTKSLLRRVDDGRIPLFGEESSSTSVGAALHP